MNKPETTILNTTDEAALLDDHAVDLFAKAMKDKLSLKRQQGFGGWHDIRQTSSARLADLLLAAVAKGDPVDVANFAMMLFCRHESHDALKGSCAKFCGGRLSAAPPPPAAPVLSDKEILKWYRATPQFSTAWAESEEEIIAIGRALLSKAQP